MSAPGLIALFSGVLGVWLTIRQSVWCWPIALVSVVCSGIDFYESRLFGDLGLQAIYFAQGVFGWRVWHARSEQDFPSSLMPRRWWPFIFLILCLLWVAMFYLLVYLKGNRAGLDALLTAASLVTTYMMIRKWAENWLLWVLIDGTYVLLYALTNLWSYALLYAVYAVMAWYGWKQWKKIRL